MNNVEKAKERDIIIFGNEIVWDLGTCCYGGTYPFRKLPLKKLEVLISKEYIDLEECQNDSPTTKEFLEFIQKYPNVTAHGYVISPNRDDFGMVIEGLEVDRRFVTDQLREDFIKLCKYADELKMSKNHSLRSWWD